MIVFISSGHKPDDERIYFKQIQSLIKAGYIIQYFTHWFNSVDLTSHNLTHINLERNQYSKHQYIDFILKKISFVKVIHIHEFDLLSIAKKIKKKYNAKIIYDVHEDLTSMWDTFSNKPKLIKNFINFGLSCFELFHLRYIDLIILANKFANQQRYYKYAPIYIIENFPQNKFFLNENIETDMVYRIIYHGQLDYSRGILELIEAFKILLKKFSNIQLTIIGKARTPQFEQEIIDRINTGKIILLNEVKHEQIWKYLHKAHLGVIPFHDVSMYSKNTPTKLFEYMASKCAIVATKLKPIYSYSDNSIIYCEANNVKSLVDSFKIYLNDINLFKSHVQTNFHLIENNYNWEKESIKLIEIYQNLLK